MTWLRRHRVVVYFVLCFALSWGAVLATVGLDGLPARMDDVPTLGLALLLGPTGAALLTLALSEGRDGFRRLGGDLCRWRISLRDLAFAIGVAPATATATLFALSLVDVRFLPRFWTADDPAMSLARGLGAGLFIGTFEELGWTGFAVPRLLDRRGVGRTGVIVGVVWGLWHFPPFWQADTFASGLGLALLLARLFSWIVAFRVAMVALYQRTRSLPAVILMHTSLVTCMLAVEPALEGNALLTYVLSWTTVLWVVATLATRRSPASVDA